MAKKTATRTNEYYIERLRLERPDIYRDLLAGKFENPAAAFRAAGLKKPRTRLQEMKNAWLKASAAERDTFKAFIGCVSLVTPPPTAPFSIDRKLSPYALAQIKAIILSRRMSKGAVMDELGFKPLNPSLGMALNRNTRLQPDMLAAVEKWIANNLGHVGS